MKKVLIGLFAASLLAASAVGYAASITLINKYDQPVNFVVSHGSVYNPVVIGTLGPYQKTMVNIEGPITPDFQFMAFPPYQSVVVTGCGHPLWETNNITVKAGWSRYTGMFACRIYS